MEERAKISSLQYLRGIAATIVVFFHATHLFRSYYGYDFLGGVFDTGFIGVDIFFVLSGFIITAAHHKDVVSRERERERESKVIFPQKVLQNIPAPLDSAPA